MTQDDKTSPRRELAKAVGRQVAKTIRLVPIGTQRVLTCDVWTWTVRITLADGRLSRVGVARKEIR